MLIDTNTKIAIIGVGNILFCDDGIGVATAEVLKECYEFSFPIDIIDGGTLGIGLIDYFASYDEIIILDTISMNDKVGSIYSFDSAQLLEFEGYKNTAHEVEVMDMIRSAKLLETCAKIKIIGIIPSDIHSVSIGLSDNLSKYFKDYLTEVLREIQMIGIQSKKIKEFNINNILKSIVKSFQ